MPIWLTALLPILGKIAASTWERVVKNKVTTLVGLGSGSVAGGAVMYVMTYLGCDLNKAGEAAFIAGLITFLQGALVTDNGQSATGIVTSMVAEQRDAQGNPIPR